MRDKAMTTKCQCWQRRIQFALLGIAIVMTALGCMYQYSTQKATQYKLTSKVSLAQTQHHNDSDNGGSGRNAELTKRWKIPMILHQTYSTTSIPKEYHKLITDCLRLNPQWKYFLWRDVDIEAFIRDHFPQYLKRYQSFSQNLQRADIIRYMVLYHYGGIYLDMDVQCTRPFFPSLLAVGPAFLDQDRRDQTHILFKREFIAMNSAMGAVPRHPFFLAMLLAVNSVPSHVKDVLWTTGPHLLTAVYRDWVQSPNQVVNPVTLLEPEVFSPIMDIGRHNFHKLCGNNSADRPELTVNENMWLRKGCKVLLSKNWKSDSTTINVTIGKHLFLHLGYDWGPKTVGKVNISVTHPKLELYSVNKMQTSKEETKNSRL